MEQDGGGYLNAKENPGALSRLACQSFHQDPFLIDTLVRAEDRCIHTQALQREH